MPLGKKPENNKPQGNAHTDAASAYGAHAQKHAVDPRETEGRVLLKAANRLKDLQDNWDKTSTASISEVLKYNRQIWMMFFDTAIEDTEGTRPLELRSNIVNLANFIFKREIEIMADPKKEKLDVLININREIAAGLLTQKSEVTNQKTK